MRDFNHLVLDIEVKKNNLSTQNWLITSLSEKKIMNSVELNTIISSKMLVNTKIITSDFEELNNSELHRTKTPLYINTSSPKTTSSFDIHNTLNINFLRKERLYTKLKYSRSPAYDIVSGGAAAILAGFIGFLVSEKFGFELVDSGDFYFLFIYIVFASFSVRPLLVTMNSNSTLTSLISLKPVLTFFVTIISFLIKKLKTYF